MPLTISIDSSSAHDVLSALPKRIRSGAARAINRTLRDTRAFMVKEMASTTGLPQLYVDDTLRTERASAEQLHGSVHAQTKRAARLIPIIALRARQVGRGPSVPGGVTFEYGGQTKTIPNAFIASMRTVGWYKLGHVGVFTRVGRSRLPIIEEKGPSLWTVFSLSAEKGRTFARQALATSMVQELDKVTASRGDA